MALEIHSFSSWWKYRLKKHDSCINCFLYCEAPMILQIKRNCYPKFPFLKSIFSTKMTIANITEKFIFYKKIFDIQQILLHKSSISFKSIFSHTMSFYTSFRCKCFLWRGGFFFVCVCFLKNCFVLFALGYCCHFIISGKFLQCLRIHAGRSSQQFFN